MKKRKIFFPLLIVTISLPFVNLVSCEKPSDRIYFNTCDWEEIVRVCDLVENEEWDEKMFCDHFFIDSNPKTVDIIEPVSPSSFNDFVGQWRMINVNGCDHLLNVIDYNKDPIFSETNEEIMATLTFQFRNLLSGNNRKGLLFQWGKNLTNKIYWYDELHSNLQESVFNMIAKNEPSLQTGIKDIKRKVCHESFFSTDFEVMEGNEKIFVPNLSNYFSHDAINSTSSDIFSDNEKDLYCAEGTQYKYYWNLIENGSIFDNFKKPINYECFAIHDLIGSKQNSYYFATPKISDTVDAWSIVINETGMFGNVQFNNVTNSLCIAPCFCL